MMIQKQQKTVRAMYVLWIIAIATVGCSQQEANEAEPEGRSVAIVTPDQNGYCPVEENAEGFMTFDQLSAAALCVSRLFGWPEGRYPDLASAPNENYANGRFESGYQYTTVGSYYQCAWLGYWVDIQHTGGDRQKQEVAEYIVTNLPNYANTIPGYPAGIQDASTTRFLQQITVSVQLGDVADVMQFTRYNCPEDGWLPLPPDVTPAVPVATPPMDR